MSELYDSEIRLDELIACVFKLYSSRIEQIVSSVKSSQVAGQDIEEIITHALSDFKNKLKDFCSYYVDDIWENYQTYARYNKATITRP